MRARLAKRIVDILLGIGLLLLMSYQVAGEAGHEWTGIAMTALMILHQFLNRRWYDALLTGRYTPCGLCRCSSILRLWFASS